MIYMKYCCVRRVLDLLKAIILNSVGESRGNLPCEWTALMGSKNKLGAPGPEPALCYLQNYDAEDVQKESYC